MKCSETMFGSKVTKKMHIRYKIYIKKFKIENREGLWTKFSRGHPKFLE